MKPYYEREGLTLHNAPALDVARSLGDDSVDLIIIDWPYFRVKSEAWDNQWSSAADFLAWMGTHLAEFQRILKGNGSYYGFASPQMAARVEVLTSQYFAVLNTITWAKPEFSTKAEMFDKDTMRAYFPSSERIIFAEHYNADNAAKGEAGYVAKCGTLRSRVFQPLQDYLNSERERVGLSLREIDEATNTCMASHWFTHPTQWALPTAKYYKVLQELFNRNQPGEYLRRDYEYLRRDYEELRRPFNAHKDAPYTDVWDFPTVAAYKAKHPCEKPAAMFRHIIEMSSKPGGVVFDPMCGSGGSAYAARNLGRVWIGGDTDPRWCDATVKRLARDFDDWQPKAQSDDLGALPMFASLPKSP